MAEQNLIVLGDAIYADIASNAYLHELYENILYNYSLVLFKMDGERKPVNIEDVLKFADLLSKSTDARNSDRHKIWAQEIVALLKEIEPAHPAVEFYLSSVLSSTGNFQGLSMMENKMEVPATQRRALLDRFYVEFSKDFMSIPAAPELQFFRSQKAVYDRLTEPYFSYSGPTSMGKSFIMRMFIKAQVVSGGKQNFVLLVPTKALINEVSSKIINDLTGLLAEMNYKVVTSAGALALEEDHSFIFVLTPERLLYLLIRHEKIGIDYLFVDEAHKISTKDSRSAFYYKVVDMLAQRERKPHVIFASPNIPNPEVYLKLLPETTDLSNQKLTSTFAPVSQVKYLMDFIDGTIQQYNEYRSTFTTVAQITKSASFCNMIAHLGQELQTIVYFNSKDKAVQMALEYSKREQDKGDNELAALAKEIKAQVHKDYFLADMIVKGVAYHIGYLPSSIRMRIETLYRNKKIHAMFCTSTLVEGVNLPADNLFITTYRKGIGRSKMSPVDFKNLIGRVGRIEYNLYGNVFLTRLDENIKPEEFVELLQKEVPEQKLSLVTELKAKQKEQIVKCLLEGNVELLRRDGQSYDSYSLTRKFALILLRDIMKGRNSAVKREFAQLLTPEKEARIKAAFDTDDNKPDDDINASVDQTKSLSAAIAFGLEYPSLDSEGNADYGEVLEFLENLHKIFKWGQYEKNDSIGHKERLKWYAVILRRWIGGYGLGSIIVESINYAQNKPGYKVRVSGKLVRYNDSPTHRNIVISDTLQAIENVILFSIANYFLKFTEAYKRIHKIEGAMDNDWYEYVEYGTTNPLSIMLQRNGFSRETSAYIRRNRATYVVLFQTGERKLRRTLANCSNVGVEKEVNDIIYNIPELFVD